MNYRRAVSVLLAATAATMLVTGSFGFTSVSADRGVDVAVVEDENAYVSVSVCQKPHGNGNENGANPVKVTVTNQYSEAFNVTTVSGDGTDKSPASGDELSPGESVRYNNAFAETEVTVEVTGGLDATVTSQVEGKCGSQSGGTETATPTQTPNEPTTATPTATPTGDA